MAVAGSPGEQRGLGGLGLLGPPALQGPVTVLPNAAWSSVLWAQATAAALRAGTDPNAQQRHWSTQGFTWILYLKFSFPCPQTLPFVLLGRICRQVCFCFGKQQ